MNWPRACARGLNLVGLPTLLPRTLAEEFFLSIPELALAAGEYEKGND